MRAEQAHTSLIVAMMMLATTQTMIRACIQIQKGDIRPQGTGPRRYSAGRSTSSSVSAMILASRPSVQCSM
jgi:hypothetical protein